MMDYRKRNIRRNILERLAALEPHALPEPALQTEAAWLVRPPMTEEEFTAAVKRMEAEGLIRNQPDDLDPDIPLWFITSAGKTLLRK